MVRAGGKGKTPVAPNCPSLASYPVFLRRVSRSRNWDEPLKNKDPVAAAKVLIERGKSVSLWLVTNDTDLRRVAIAINEGRHVSFHERLSLLPIHQDELDGVGVEFTQIAGLTSCKAAEVLHHDILLDERSAVGLCQILIDVNRKLATCTKSQMKKAENISRGEGCFATVPESSECECGAIANR